MKILGSEFCPRITRMNANKENDLISIYKTRNGSFAKSKIISLIRVH